MRWGYGSRPFSRNARYFLAASFLQSLGTGAFNLLFGIILMNSGQSETFLGYILSLGLLANGVFSLPAGILADIWGKKNVLIIALILTSGGLMGQVLMPVGRATALFSLLFGMGQGMLAAVTLPLLAENSDSSTQPYLFSVNFSLTTAALVLGSLCVGKLPGLFSAHWSLVLFSVLPGIAVIFAALMGQNDINPTARSRSRTQIDAREYWRVVKSSRVARDVFVYNFQIGLGAGLVIPFFNIFLSQKLHASLDLVGIVMSISQVGVASAGLLAPLLMHSLGKVKSVVIFQMLSIPLLLMIALPQSLGIVIVSFLLRNILMNMNNPISGSFTMEITPLKLRSTVSSLVSMSQNLSRALSASIGGWLMGTMGYSSPYFLTALLYLSASLFYWRVFGPHEKESVQESRIGI
ncbi:MFS transporter [Desulfitobacterium sp.]|uniref:MFS transporter n=1 Tax=Desulfitobacterium sp. TaxID=49981 RepID=UPI002D0BF2F6|nr:MFS transporter [Desulfitobacterium sp.]HVJ50397.1 MFS transporter [Desulfitobacterium sp.]